MFNDKLLAVASKTSSLRSKGLSQHVFQGPRGRVPVVGIKLDLMMYHDADSSDMALRSAQNRFPKRSEDEAGIPV